MIQQMEFDTPLGTMRAVARDGCLAALDFLAAEVAAKPAEPSPATGIAPLLRRVREQVLAYFDGRLRRFDLPLELQGTAFQRRVWERLRQIPYGETIAYGRLASALGMPGSARAVGGAVGRNPVPLVVPCHRVIGHDGKLVGFASGLDRKRFLLALERSAQSGGKGP
jgi:methylated-DNA-[protein]-cysteine S-methyltransferase